MTDELQERFELEEAASVIEAIRACAGALDSAGVFCGHGTDNTWDESVQLVLYTLGLPPDSPASVGEQTIAPDARVRIGRLLQRRIDERVPLPYLTGEAWFAGLRFQCDQRALVPRSPIAELIIGGFQPWYADGEPTSILDLCCGGGAIGIASAVCFPQARVVLSDIDAQALTLAAENVCEHGVSGRVECVRGNLFAGLLRERFDIILCNPPYVDDDDLAAMPPEYYREPPIGLGAGNDGLDLARQILANAAAHLNPDGLLLLEVGNSWVALEAEFPQVAFTWVELESGGHGVLAMQARELRESASLLAYTGTRII